MQKPEVRSQAEIRGKAQTSEAGARHRVRLPPLSGGSLEQG